MSFQIKLKTFPIKFLVFLLSLFFFLASLAALNAQTAEISAQGPESSSAAAALAAGQTAETKIEISGEIGEPAVSQPPATVAAPAPAPEQVPLPPAVKPLNVTASIDTVFITPGQTLDLSSITLSTQISKDAVKIESWSADTGSVNINTYTPPDANFKGIVALYAHYMDGGVIKKKEIELKVRKNYLEERLIVLYMALILAVIILLSINSALSGKNYFIRRIGGLNAIDEAIGRSTEMGKPVLYLTGLSDMSSISTIASISILSYVATKTAEYETSLLVPCCRSLVMNTAREVVKESYLEAGKPDAYNAENIKYITDDQFGFVSGVDGIMMREKPAANFYLGHFMAESLIYAETGNSIGAIQIAGTSEFSQIPFFVAACDYCLIGEELFAASAYLSRKPKDVGTLRGQDIAKLAIMVIVIIGVVLETLAVINPGLSSSLGMYKSVFQTK